MSDINPLSTYYSGLQNSGTVLQKESKKEKVSSSHKLKFSELLKSQTGNEEQFNIQDFPVEIRKMPIEDAAIWLKDQIDIAGDEVSKNATTENLLKFKKNVQQFIKFIIANNYEINSKKQKGVSHSTRFFSNYDVKIRPRDPRIIVQTLNTQLDNLTRGMLFNQKDNLKLLAQINEIKGMIVDLMQS